MFDFEVHLRKCRIIFCICEDAPRNQAFTRNVFKNPARPNVWSSSVNVPGSSPIPKEFLIYAYPPFFWSANQDQTPQKLLPNPFSRQARSQATHFKIIIKHYKAFSSLTEKMTWLEGHLVVLCCGSFVWFYNVSFYLAWRWWCSGLTPKSISVSFLFCIKRWGVLEAKKRTMKSGANHDFTHASHITDFARFRGIHHRPACGLRQEAGRWFIAAHSRGSTVTRSACYLADVDVGQDTACLNCPQPRSLGAAPDDKPLRKGRAAPRIAWTGSNEVSGQVEFSSLKKNKTCVKDLWYIKPFSDLQFCFFGHLPLKMHTFEGIFSDPSNLFWLCADPSDNTQFRRWLG